MERCLASSIVPRLRDYEGQVARGRPWAVGGRDVGCGDFGELSRVSVLESCQAECRSGAPLKKDGRSVPEGLDDGSLARSAWKPADTIRPVGNGVSVVNTVRSLPKIK
jgi:hypothetical protein